MDMNNTPEPRMPLVENLEFLDLMGVISSPVQWGCARTLRSTRIPRSIALRRQSGVSHQSLGSAVSIGTTFGWRNRQAQLAATRLALKPGAIELLNTLDDLGLPRAIATSSARETVEHHLEFHDLVGRFHHIVGHGDYALGKPAPDPFLKAAERLGVEPRSCLALEDSHNGVRSAAAACMMTVMVPDLLEPTDEIRGLCAFVARDRHEMRHLLLVAEVSS
jgi:HAD superfamily hydrolase (TIGR01509 family)